MKKLIIAFSMLFWACGDTYYVVSPTVAETHSSTSIEVGGSSVGIDSVEPGSSSLEVSSSSAASSSSKGLSFHRSLDEIPDYYPRDTSIVYEDVRITYRVVSHYENELIVTNLGDEEVTHVAINHNNIRLPLPQTLTYPFTDDECMRITELEVNRTGQFFRENPIILCP